MKVFRSNVLLVTDMQKELIKSRHISFVSLFFLLRLPPALSLFCPPSPPDSRAPRSVSLFVSASLLVRLHVFTKKHTDTHKWLSLHTKQLVNYLALCQWVPPDCCFFSELLSWEEGDRGEEADNWRTEEWMKRETFSIGRSDLWPHIVHVLGTLSKREEKKTIKNIWMSEDCQTCFFWFKDPKNIILSSSL